MKEMRDQADFSLEVRVEQLGRLYCPAGWVGEMHSHAFWELICVVEGEGCVQYGQTQLAAPEGGLFLIRPYERHAFLLHEGRPARIVYLGFRYSRNYRLWKCSDAYRDVRTYLPEAEQIAGFLAGLCEKSEKIALELRAFEAMQAVMPLLRWLDERNAVEAGHNQSGLLCRKVEKYLRENLDKNVTVQEIAASLYLSPHYLGSVFHQRTKMTIKQYQMRLKMEAAITMMRDSELSVGDVSSRLGFVTPQYFSKSFKDYFGITPMEAKKR